MNEVHCWTWSLEQIHDINRLFEILSEAERARAATFRSELHRRQYVIAHAGLRAILASHLGCNPSQLVFAVAPDGKPFLIGAHCFFNLAHTGQYAVCALAGTPVGVDIEHMLPLPDALPVSAQIASLAELQALRDLSPADVEAAFYRLWVRKEAFLKATGEGLLGKPTQSHVGIDPWPATAWHELGSTGDGLTSWLGMHLPAPAGHVAAVVVAGTLGTVSHFRPEGRLHEVRMDALSLSTDCRLDFQGLRLPPTQ